MLFVVLLVAGALGVWVGLTYAGTENGVWVERGLGAFMVLAGVSLFLSRDLADRTHSHLFGAGFALMGVAHFMPLGWWRTGMSLVGLAVMLAAVVRRHRAAASGSPS